MTNALLNNRCSCWRDCTHLRVQHIFLQTCIIKWQVWNNRHLCLLFFCLFFLPWQHTAGAETTCRGCMSVEGWKLGSLRIFRENEKKQWAKGKGERNESEMWERDRAAGKKQTERRSGDRGSMEISEKWFSLASGSGVQSLGIDLFKIQSSVRDKHGVLKSLSKPTREHSGPKPLQ